MKETKKLLVLIVAGLFFGLCLAGPLAAQGKVNINTDPIETLVTLKYVGEKLAGRIVEYRQATPFKTPADIMKVKGIGQKIFDANKDRIIVKGG